MFYLFKTLQYAQAEEYENMAVSSPQTVARTVNYDAIKRPFDSKTAVVPTLHVITIGALAMISSVIISYPFYELYASSIGTSCFCTTYDSGVPFMPQNMRIYSSTTSNVFDQSLLCTIGVVT